MRGVARRHLGPHVLLVEGIHRGQRPGISNARTNEHLTLVIILVLEGEIIWLCLFINTGFQYTTTIESHLVN